MVGSLQIIGWVINSKSVRGLGMAYCSSPLPIVFTEVKGVETFAADFFVCYRDGSGTNQKVQITPQRYSMLKGPYNRRNVYGAAISYGPVLDSTLWSSVLKHGTCNGSLLQEMGIPDEAENPYILIQSKTVESGKEWILKVDCDE
ncbi:MAG: hypothetical protein HRT74_09415 [Flavobacteriales bacterium]|nr:hypothetical protein [Flavobacteriales bacterium]